MQLRNQVEWALHCCAILAGLPEGKYLPSKDLAELHGVPKEYLSKALQSLSHAGLIEGTLGPTGGYRLAKDPAKITFLDIVEAVEGRTSTFICTEVRKNNPCLAGERSPGAEKSCAVARVMWAADEAWRTSLRGVTLAQLNSMVVADVPARLLKKTADWVAERL